MVFYKEDENKDSSNKTVIFTCNCGCGSEFHISKDVYKYEEPKPGETESFYFSSHSGNWYTEQDGIFRIIGRRIKRAWSALRGKDYLYQDVCMRKEEFSELVDEMNKLLKED